MSGCFLDSLFATAPSEAAGDPTHPFWYEDAGGQTSAAGKRVNETTSMRVSAVYACVHVLAETLASLPLFVYERQERGKKKSTDHPLHSVLHDQPNNRLTSTEFFELMMGHLALRGNAYAEIIPGLRGAVEQLLPIHPDFVEVEELGNRKLRYVIREENRQERRLTQEQVLHVRGLSSDGICGMSVLGAARETFGLALGQQEYGATVFANQTKLSGVLEHPGKIDHEGYKRIRESWQSTYGGSRNAHKTAVLEEGMKFNPISMTSEDAQFIESRQFQVTDICRFFRVPPHMIAELSRATFSNIEHQSIGFVVYTMMPWIRRWEQAIQRDLMVDERFFARFSVNGLLRGDVKSRMEAYQIGVQNGWLSPNDVRELEDMNPVDGGDVYLAPLNMTTIDKVGEEPEQPEPAPPEEPTEEPDEDEEDAQSVAFDNLRAEVAANARESAAQIERRFEALTEAIGRWRADNEETDDGGRAMIRQAHVDLVAFTLHRLRRKEVNAATRASNDPKRFLAWLDEFYEKHIDTAATALEPAVRVVVAGRDMTPDIHEPLSRAFAREFVEASREQLLDASGEVTADELPNKVRSIADEWERQVPHSAEEIVSKLENQP